MSNINKLKTEAISSGKKFLFERTPDMLAILDRDGRIIDCNQNFEDNTQYSKNELLGVLGTGDLVFDGDIDKVRSVFEELKIKKKILNIPLKIKRKDNSVFYTVWSGVRLCKDNSFDCYLITGKDLSEVKELENRLLVSQDYFHQEKMALLGELSARLAHDLRNPLSIITMALDNIKIKYNVSGEKENLFLKIDRSIARILHQTDDVLEFVRDTPVILKKTKLSLILSECFDSIKIPDCIRIVTPKKDIEIYCDFNKFVSALNNIILNSIQSMSGIGLLAISSEITNEKIIIEIEDSGKGIPKEKLYRVFEPLYTTKQHGTGLGLVGSKSIIKSHGGDILVLSPPTVFKIILPKTPKTKFLNMRH